MCANTATDSPEEHKPTHSPGRWQFGPGHLLVATTGIAAVLGLAAWGGWLQSDAVVYAAIAVVAAVFSSTARHVLLAASVVVAEFLLAAILAMWLFGVHGRGVDLRFLWIFAGFSLVSGVLLRLYTKAGLFSLMASLLVAEAFTAIVIVYTDGYSTLFAAFANEDRAQVFEYLRDSFPAFLHWLILAPWLAGIVLGEILARYRRPDGRRGILVVTSCAVLVGTACYVAYRPLAIRCRVLREWASLEDGIHGKRTVPNGLFELTRGTVDDLVDDVVPHEIRGVSFYQVDKVNFAHLRLFPEIREIWFPFSSLRDAHLHDIVSLKKLESLHLERTQITDRGLATLSQCRSLTNLSLCGTAVTDQGMKDLAALPALSVLDLSETSISDDGLKHLCQCPSLRSLTLAGTRLTDSGVAQLLLPRSLNRLDLRGTAISDAAVKCLVSCPQITELNLMDTNVGDEGVSSLSRLPRLTRLILRRTKITDQSMENWPVNNSLVSLNLGSTRIGDPTIQAIVRQFPNLEELVIDSTSVTASGLSRLGDSRRLDRVTLTPTKIEPAVIEDFRARHPMIRID